MFDFTRIVSLACRVSLLVVVCGCVSLAEKPKEPISLKFLSEMELKQGTQFQNEPVGGLSALFPVDSQHFYALSDDRSYKAPARIYLIRLTAERPEVVKVIYLKKENRTFEAGAIDPEGLIVLPWGNFLVATEGDTNLNLGPELIEFSSKGDFVRSIKPAGMQPGPQSGVRNNLGFEGLTLARDGKSIYVGLESALVQDGPVATDKKGSWNRILEYTIHGKDIKYRRYWLYPTEPIENPGGVNRAFVNGVSEILEVGDRQLIVMERGVYVSPDKVFHNVLRTFLVRLGETKRLEKSLLLDFGDFASQLSGGVDNQESLALIQNGQEHHLLTVSDDNFNPKQRTVFFRLQVLGL